MTTGEYFLALVADRSVFSGEVTSFRAPQEILLQDSASSSKVKYDTVQAAESHLALGGVILHHHQWAVQLSAKKLSCFLDSSTWHR